MSNSPLMPMATAVWLVENTTLTFKQIAEFCKLHEVEIQGIADGEVAKGIKAYNPIISGQLTREEIELSSSDENRPLQIKSSDIEISNAEKKISYYLKNENKCLKIIQNANLFVNQFKNQKREKLIFLAREWLDGWTVTESNKIPLFSVFLQHRKCPQCQEPAIQIKMKLCLNQWESC